MGVNGSGRKVRGRPRRLGGVCGAALGALVLARIGSGAPAWPEPSIDPLATELVPEAFSESARGMADSVRAMIDTLLAASPPPPDRPSPLLVGWIADRLAYGGAQTVAAFIVSYSPVDWAQADPSGLLPLAAALACAEAERPRDALRWIEEGRMPPGLGQYRDLLRLELLDMAFDSAAAALHAEELRARFPREEWTLPAARRLLRAKERAGDAEGLLREGERMRRTLGRGADETAARFRALLALGRHGAARAVGDTLLREHPGTRTARMEALRRFREAPELAARREGGALFRVLMRHGMLDSAESLLVLMGDPDSMRIVWLEGLLQGRRNGEVLDRTDSRRCPADPSLAARWHLVRARAARNSARWDPMARAYASAAAFGRETRQRALVEWGREAESEGREALADSLYTLLAELPAMASEGRLRRAIARFAAGLWGEALRDLDLLGGTDQATAAAFWRFKIHEGRADSVAAKGALAEARRGSGYYARRADAEWRRRSRGESEEFWRLELEELRRPGGAMGVRDTLRCPPAGPAAIEHARLLRLFRRFGRVDWADDRRRALEGALAPEGRAEAFLCLGLPDLAIRAGILGGGSAPHLRYPRPYWAWVLREARAVALRPEFIWALARRESLFDPGAVSSAGATGLLQLMKPTARETAERWGMPAAPLERGDRNLALGCRHMRDLMDDNDWPLPALVAAYNAGAAKASEWAARWSDPDLLIERVGWRETREFVRFVLDGYWTYCYAYESERGRTRE